MWTIAVVWGASASAANRSVGSVTVTPAIHGVIGSSGSGRSRGSSDHSIWSVATTGVSNNEEGVEPSAPTAGSTVTSRSTPRSWSRSSSALWNRSAGSAAVPLSSRRYSESCAANTGTEAWSGSECSNWVWKPLELEDEDGQGAARSCRCPTRSSCLRSEPRAPGTRRSRRSATRRRRCADAAQIDQLHGVADLDEVGRLEVAEEQPGRVQVGEGGEHLQHERDRLVDRKGIEPSAAGRRAVLEDRVEALAADVLHDDVGAAVGVGLEVVDLDDERVLDLGEEPLLADRGLVASGSPALSRPLRTTQRSFTLRSRAR